MQWDKLRFVELFEMTLRTQNASPGGKLSSAARLMRNGEMLRFCMHYR